MNQSNNAYQGFEAYTHKLQMTGKMLLFTGGLCLALQTAVLYMASLFFIPAINRELAFVYPLSKLAAMLFLGNLSFDIDGTRLTAAQISSLSATKIYLAVAGRWFMAAIVSCAAWLAYPALLGIFKAKASELKNDEHVRGAKLISETELKKQVGDTGATPGLLKFGSITIPDDMETRHAAIFGLTGAGKSTLLLQYLDAIQSANRRCTANDFKGELTSLFYRPDVDKLLNPLDERGLGWTLSNEIKMVADFNAIVGSLIPPSSGEDRFWSMAAQDVLRGLMAALWKRGEKQNTDLWRAATSPISEIAELLKTTPMGAAGHSYIQDASSKQAASVIAVLMSYISWLEFSLDGPFATRDWIDSGSGTIFLTGRTEIENTIRPYTSLFVDLLGKRILSAPDTRDPQKTIHLLLDEFSNMQKLPTIKRLTTAGRSKRAIITLAAQEIAAIEHINGREDTRTLLNNTATKFIMQLGDPDSMDYFTRLAGREEYWQASTTFTMSVDESKGGENHGRQLQTRDVIMASEFRKLQVGQGYLLMPSMDPALVTIPRTGVNNREPTQPEFILRPGLNLEELHYKSEAIAARAEEIKSSEPPELLKKQVEANVTNSLTETEQQIDFDL